MSLFLSCRRGGAFLIQEQRYAQGKGILPRYTSVYSILRGGESCYYSTLLGHVALVFNGVKNTLYMVDNFL